MKIATIVWAAALAPLWAQEIKLPVNLDKLAEKAEESAVVTLDKSMLQLVGKFVDKDEPETRKVLAALDGIYVRNFQFAEAGAYSPADVEAVRRQIQTPPWSRLVGVRSKHSGGDVDVYLKDAGNGQVGGIVVIAAEPRELTIVNITGTLDPARLADLGGDFGIPKLEFSESSRKPQ